MFNYNGDYLGLPTPWPAEAGEADDHAHPWPHHLPDMMVMMMMMMLTIMMMRTMMTTTMMMFTC